MNAVLKPSRLSAIMEYPKAIRELTDVRAKRAERENIRQKINSLKDRATELEIRINEALFGDSP